MVILTKFSLDSDAAQCTLIPTLGGDLGNLANETVDGSKIQEGDGSQRLENINKLTQYVVSRDLSNRNWSGLDFKMEYFVPAAGNIDTTKGVQVLIYNESKFSIYVWDSLTTDPTLTTDWNTLHIPDISDAGDNALALRSAGWDPTNITKIQWSYQMKSSGSLNDWWSDYLRFEGDTFEFVGGNLPTDGAIDSSSYDAAGARYETNGVTLRVVLEKPEKLDRLFDDMGDQSRTRHFWGRKGHTLKFLEDFETTITGSSQRTFEQDKGGISEIVWSNSTSSEDLINKITAQFDRDFVRTARRNEAYSGTITREDTDSQDIYGIRENKISNNENVYLYDFVVSSGQAEQISDLNLDFFAFPKKMFTIRGDWLNYDLEPEDRITVSGAELKQDYLCRIDDIITDTNAMTLIRAKQV